MDYLDSKYRQKKIEVQGLSPGLKNRGPKDEKTLTRKMTKSNEKC